MDWIIRLRTRSLYTHVLMVLRLSWFGMERMLCYQAEPSCGVSLMGLSLYLEAFSGRAWLFRLNKLRSLAVNAHYIADLSSHAMENLGKRYDWPGVLHYLLPIFKPKAQAFFCSELIAEDYQYAGLGQGTFQSPSEFLDNTLLDAPVLL